MNNLEQRKSIREESRTRLYAMPFGYPVTNICAGEGNPMRHGLFVKYKSRTNVATITDGRGNFADVEGDVIHPGHLSVEESSDLFAPVWNAIYSK